MRGFLSCIGILCWAFWAEARDPIVPYETNRRMQGTGAIDRAVLSVLESEGIEPAYLCSDEVFLRRVYLDLIGTLPKPEEVRQFARDRDPQRRERLVERLLERPEFADYWSLRFCDILRVKSEFPINLWPNGVQAYHRWVHQVLAENRGYDEMVRELLTASGSNFRVPAVNFYRAAPGKEPGDLAQMVALSFMGSRTEHWDEESQRNLSVFFSRLSFKKTEEWKEEIVFLDPSVYAPLEVCFPDGSRAVIRAGEDPRRAFADWLVQENNPWFARNLVNRAWYWFMGTGVIHEPDDIRPDNPPVNPELLTCLERVLVDSGYDLKLLFRAILTSQSYQQSSIPFESGLGPEAYGRAERYFACYRSRRLDAEVLIDAIDSFTGGGEVYSSPIPEPYTFVPDSRRTIELADGSITSPFLDMFGRPSRDTGLELERDNEPSEAQLMYLLNSSEIQTKIQGGQWLSRMGFRRLRNPQELAGYLYVSLFSREPTRSELEVLRGFAGEHKWGGRVAAVDLAWALINSKEFLYRH